MKTPIAFAARFGTTALFVASLMEATHTFAGQINETVTSILPGFSQGASQANVENSTLMPLILDAPNEDDGFAGANLNGSAGIASLSAHACSGPTGGEGGFFVGGATGGASIDYSASYQITSTTLPFGAPVFVYLVANGARSESVAFDSDPNNPSSTNVAGVSGEGHINFSVGSSQYAFPGTFVHSNNYFDGEQKFKTGLFNGQDTTQLGTVVGGTFERSVVPAHVGDNVSVAVIAGITTTSGAIVGADNQADTEVVLNWGISPFSDDIQLVSLTGGPAPPAGAPSLDQVLTLVPPRPPTVDGGVPEPSTIALLAIVFCIRGRRFGTSRRQHHAS